MQVRLRPSDSPRDPRFRDPSTLPYRDAQGVYHVFSYEHVKSVLLNAENQVTRETSPWLPDEKRHMALDFMWALEPFTLQGDDGRHDSLRAVVEPWFRTRAVRTMEPVIREVARHLLRSVIAKGTGEFNLATELAYCMSIRVICRLVGIELEREQFLRKNLDEFSQAHGYEEIPPQWELQAYFWRMIADRLGHPREELLDVLATAWKDGRISDKELLGYISGFVLAGTDTTGTSLANAFTLLDEFGYLDHVWKNLDDIEALQSVVEEVLRFGTPFPVKPMVTLKELRFDDLVVPKGSVLNVWYAAANRDVAVNGPVNQSDPAVFDPRRSPNRHLGFGYGKHYCLGGDLARLETRILMQEALSTLPNLHMDAGKPFVRYAGIVDGITEAHFTFDQQAAERRLPG